MTKENKWSVDLSHSEISFSVKHLMISRVTGSFTVFDASIYTTSKDFLTAEIDLWIDVASITTGDLKRDEHLKSSEFFDVKNHKQITFTSRTIAKEGLKDTHELWGELTMIGITKNIKLDVQFGGIVKDPYGNEKAGFSLTGKINRSDWGLTWNTALETGGVVMSDEVIISCEIELTNQGAKELKMELEAAEPTQIKF